MQGRLDWSDASTWSGGQVPQAGGTVTIGEGMDVVLDVSPPALNGINVGGKLSFSNDADLELTTEWITLRGELEIGTESRPHTADATITLIRETLNDLMLGNTTLEEAIASGDMSITGNRLKVETLFELMDNFNVWFNLVTPVSPAPDS